MKSATTFKSEIKHTQKFAHRDFWSNLDPGKTHKGKTSERGEAFYYSEFRENFLLQQRYYQQNFTNLSQVCPKHFPRKQCQSP
jgi:hypothetical protein